MNPSLHRFTRHPLPGLPALLWARREAPDRPWVGANRCWWPDGEGFHIHPIHSHLPDLGGLPEGARRADDLVSWPCGGGVAWSSGGTVYRMALGQPVQAVGSLDGLRLRVQPSGVVQGVDGQGQLRQSAAPGRLFQPVNRAVEPWPEPQRRGDWLLGPGQRCWSMLDGSCTDALLGAYVLPLDDQRWISVDSGGCVRLLAHGTWEELSTYSLPAPIVHSGLYEGLPAAELSNAERVALGPSGTSPLPQDALIERSSTYAGGRDPAWRRRRVDGQPGIEVAKRWWPLALHRAEPGPTHVFAWDRDHTTFVALPTSGA